jgi:hypothetical protein
VGINLDPPSEQSYLGILRSVVDRIAANGGGCETWCIGLVSAILIVVADRKRTELALLATKPEAFCRRSWFWLSYQEV